MLSTQISIYISFSWGDYICYIKLVTILNPKTGLRFLDYEHEIGKTDNDVTLLWFKSFDLMFLPVLDGSVLYKYPNVASLFFDARNSKTSQLTLSGREYMEFLKIVKLEVIYFGSKLNEVPGNFLKYAMNLREFYFNNNAIVMIPEELFINSPNLNAVNFNNNQIKVISENLFGKNPKMTHIFLQNNQIISLPPKLLFWNPLMIEFNSDGNGIDVPYNFYENNPKMTKF